MESKEEFKVFLSNGEEVGSTDSVESAARLGEQFGEDFHVVSPESPGPSNPKDASDQVARFRLLELDLGGVMG